MRKTRMTIAAVALALSTVLVSTTAEAAPSGCPAGAACSWKDAGYAGPKLNFVRNVDDYSKYPGFPLPTYNDKTSSVYNNGFTKRWTRFYVNARWRGQYKQYDPHSGKDNLATVSFNDRISSACFRDYCK
jgi:hypothetical protein